MQKFPMLAATMSAALSANAAMASSGSYNGNWPVTITGSQMFNGSHCVQLSGDTTGTAILDNTYEGGFQVTYRTILVFLYIDGSGQEPASLLFSSPATDGNIGKGGFHFIQGSYPYDSGKAVFGTKGGC
jgi:hypothetical protein